MATVTDEKISEVARKLWADLYETSFRGKDRGRYCLTRGQLMMALGVVRLHAVTVTRLQDEALALGLLIVDLDDLFPCIEVTIIRRYRRPPTEIFLEHFPIAEDDEAAEGEDDE